MKEDRTDRAAQSSSSGSSFDARAHALQSRVNEVAKALQERGMRPTVTRVRAALGGGSPNDLTPALKHWRESVLPALGAGAAANDRESAGRVVPTQIADLMYELWQRSTVAAVVELKGGPTAQQVAARTEEAQSLRKQVLALRDLLQRESLAYGELRARVARYEVIAREALKRADESELRERDLLREVGTLRQRVAELKTARDHQRALRAGVGMPPRRSATGVKKARAAFAAGLKTKVKKRRVTGVISASPRSKRRLLKVRGRRRSL